MAEKGTTNAAKGRRKVHHKRRYELLLYRTWDNKLRKLRRHLGLHPGDSQSRSALDRLTNIRPPEKHRIRGRVRPYA